MTRATILICDDETHLREMVGEYLVERGYDIAQAADAAAMQTAMQKQPADLVILDINMPGEDGLTALRSLRTTSNVPVIMLTAATDVVDRVVGLELGADDYLGKPVDLRELEARIKAVLRHRPEPQPAAASASDDDGVPGAIRFGNCRLDRDGARLFGPDGAEIPLTSGEFGLLCFFVENRGRPLSRAQLIDHTGEGGRDPADRSVDLRISRLRRKIEANPKKPKILRTVHGVGYIFD